MLKNKTCELCVFNMDNMCRRFPHASGPCGQEQVRLVAYPEVSIMIGSTRSWAFCCAEYKESD